MRVVEAQIGKLFGLNLLRAPEMRLHHADPGPGGEACDAVDDDACLNLSWPQRDGADSSERRNRVVFAPSRSAHRLSRPRSYSLTCHTTVRWPRAMTRSAHREPRRLRGHAYDVWD
jgi:hypothetical protein